MTDFLTYTALTVAVAIAWAVDPVVGFVLAGVLVAEVAS